MLEPDLFVLSTGIVPNDLYGLADSFGIELNEDGFFHEAEYKWQPVNSKKRGVFACGLAHSPRSISEAIATAQAAAQGSGNAWQGRGPGRLRRRRGPQKFVFSLRKMHSRLPLRCADPERRARFDCDRRTRLPGVRGVCRRMSELRLGGPGIWRQAGYGHVGCRPGIIVKVCSELDLVPWAVLLRGPPRLTPKRAAMAAPAIMERVVKTKNRTAQADGPGAERETSVDAAEQKKLEDRIGRWEKQYRELFNNVCQPNLPPGPRPQNNRLQRHGFRRVRLPQGGRFAKALHRSFRTR